MFDIACLLLPAAAFLVSLVCSTVGISGAFLLLPVQMMLLGTTAPSLSATNQLFNLIATPAGVARYVREGRMVWPLALILAAGSVPGLFLGFYLRVTLLPGGRTFTLFAACVLLFLALTLKPRRKNGGGRAFGSAGEKAGASRVTNVVLSKRTLAYDFAGGQYRVGVLPLSFTSFCVGIVGGAYGIGGGALIAPFLVGIFRLPIHSLGAATLFSTLVTAASAMVAAFLFSGILPNLAIAPDLTVGVLLGIGGVLGMSLGASLQMRFGGEALGKLLKALVLLAALSMAARALLG